MNANEERSTPKPEPAFSRQFRPDDVDLDDLVQALAELLDNPPSRSQPKANPHLRLAATEGMNVCGRERGQKERR